MKIGITLSENFRKYLEEIAILNNLSPTTICSIIVENYLSFNREKSRKPIFTKKYSVVYADTSKKEIVDEAGKKLEEEQAVRTWDEIMKDLDREAEKYIDNATGDDDDGLPF